MFSLPKTVFIHSDQALRTPPLRVYRLRLSNGRLHLFLVCAL